MHQFSLKVYNSADHEHIQKAIINQNKTYFPSLCIKKIVLTLCTQHNIRKNQGKKHENIIIKAAYCAMADKLIKYGIILDSKILYEKLYYCKAKLTIYFNYNGFRHISHACNQKLKCEHCSKKHNSKDCFNKDKASKCLNCHRKHKA